MNQTDIYRVLDANLNRVKEALRVIEEVARFIRTSDEEAGVIRALRHEVTHILLALPETYRKLVESRDSGGDVGRKNTAETNLSGISKDALLQRNFKRAQEAARVLEEFSREIDPGIAPKIQEFRFKLYDLEKQMFER